MKAGRVVGPLLALVIALPASTRAQDDPPPPLEIAAPEPGNPRWIWELGGGVGQPIGEFADHVDPNFQLDVSLARLLDPGRRWGWRLSMSFMTHSSLETSYQVPGVSVEVTTNNLLLGGTLGPQVMLGGWPLQAFVHAGVGTTSFSTETTAGGPSSENRETNFEKSKLALDVGAALLWRPWRGPFLFELGARYLHNGRATYVTKDGVDISSGTLVLTPVESDANLMLYRLGFAMGWNAWVP